MDVALAADRGRVAELLGHALDYARHRPLAWLDLAQWHHLQHREVGGGPGAEILGGDVMAGAVAQIGVDILRIDAV